jgi:hypothetical protein
MSFLSIIGICSLWFAVGTLLEIAAERALAGRYPQPNKVLAFIEVALVYGPFGVAYYIYDAFARWLS